MVTNKGKDKWSKATIFNRPGASVCSMCGKKFIKKEVFFVRETKTTWFRGDDEVDFFCVDCSKGGK